MAAPLRLEVRDSTEGVSSSFAYRWLAPSWAYRVNTLELLQLLADLTSASAQHWRFT